MPSYGTAQAGYNGPPNQGLNITALEVGESTTLFNGTETPAASLASVAIARGYAGSGGGSDNGITFNVKGMPSGMTIDIQVAGHDIDGEYYTVATLSGDTNGNTAYPDVGRSPFYRAKILAYTSGTMPTVTANR